MSNTLQRRADAKSYWPLAQLILARVREFYREPEALFWVYGFPILMIVALGIAFRNRPAETIAVAIVDSPGARAVYQALEDPAGPVTHYQFEPQLVDAEEGRRLLRTGAADLVVRVTQREAGPTGRQRGFEYLYDPTRSESTLARAAVDDALQRSAGRKDEVPVADVDFAEPGGRYIDFLVPGLLGMSLMGGGLWGVGFVTVDMRIRKLLKRLLATPMSKSQFLAGIILSRLLFLIPEVLVLLLFARLAFGVVNHGSLIAVVVLIVLGAGTFAGIGLLVACRARTLEAVSGLMNLVMLPMWVFSGIFFSAERFPDAMQPFVQALPLTVLIDALRAVMIEGAGLAGVSVPVLVLAAWTVVSFALALRLFRWT